MEDRESVREEEDRGEATGRKDDGEDPKERIDNHAQDVGDQEKEDPKHGAEQKLTRWTKERRTRNTPEWEENRVMSQERVDGMESVRAERRQMDGTESVHPMRSDG